MPIQGEIAVPLYLIEIVERSMKCSIVMRDFQSLGITLLGHQRRILNSLKEAKAERRQRATERVNAALHDDETDSGQESRLLHQMSCLFITKIIH